MADKISVTRVDEMMRVVFEALKEAGGQAKARDVLAAVESRANLTDYEKERTKSGAIRWQTHVRFYSVDCVKAGYLVKGDGQWTLTEKGEKALKLPPGQMIRAAQREYQALRRAQDDDTESVEPEDTAEQAERQAVYEQANEAARAEIEEHIDNLGAYDFQTLVAELLRAMGYYISFVARPGPDGGRDVEAYKDPLGTTAPRIKVQVKHREQKLDAREVRELVGILRTEGDIGLVVSSNGFTREAELEIQRSNKHIERMDLNRLISLWQEHYDRISETGKSLLPLVKVYFLTPAGE